MKTIIEKTARVQHLLNIYQQGALANHWSHNTEEAKSINRGLNVNCQLGLWFKYSSNKGLCIEMHLYQSLQPPNEKVVVCESHESAAVIVALMCSGSRSQSHVLTFVCFIQRLRD